jgi:alpha-beta hydrolase superfamily lysophospholipase
MVLLSGIIAVLTIGLLILAAVPPKTVEKTVTVASDSYIFKDQSFSFQFLRTLSAAVYGGADFGECIETAKRIREGDMASWCAEWTATADRIKGMGDAALAEGHEASAAECYLRAANYYRAAEFYLHGNSSDPRIVILWQKARDLYVQSLTLSQINYEAVRIPFENTTLPGYFYPADESGAQMATLILLNGFDGDQEELYPTVLAAQRRGYSVLTFEGPGQGEVVRLQHLYFRANWESVVTPVLDYLQNRTDVDRARIALWGISMAGYLAPRAAAFDGRLAALICDGGVYDIVGGMAMQFAEPGTNMTKARQDFINWLTYMPGQADQFFQGMMENSTNMRWSIEHGRYVFGQNSTHSYMLALAQMSMGGLAGRIACPTLVCDGTNDTAMPRGQAMMLYSNLTCVKEYHLFTATDGAGLHCQLGAMFQGNMVKLDWLERNMPS